MIKLLLIWRYFIKKRVALIAVAAVTLLVMLVLVVLSVMSGLLADTKRQNHLWSGDIVIRRESLVGFPFYDEFIAQLYAEDLAASATPVIKTFALTRMSGPLQPTGVKFSVQLMGIRLPEFCRTTGFQNTLGRMADQAQPTFTVPKAIGSFSTQQDLTGEQRRRGCIGGIYRIAGNPDAEHMSLARRYWLSPSGRLRFQLTVVPLTSTGLPARGGIGQSQTFWYVDDSKAGPVDVDMSTLYVDFDQLQKLSDMDGSDGQPSRAHEIRIKLTDGVELQAGRQKVADLWEQFVRPRAEKRQGKLLTDVTVQTWKEYRRSYIAPAENEKSLMIVIFCMIAAVAVFIVFAIFYMIVTEKIRDLGIIKSVGGSAWGVSQIFLGYGILVGMVGAALGTGLGVIVVRNSNEIEAWLDRAVRALGWEGFRIWNPEVYAISRIPDAVDYTQAAVIAAVAVLVSLIGAVLPSRRAAKLQVIETLRIE